MVGIDLYGNIVLDYVFVGYVILGDHYSMRKWPAILVFARNIKVLGHLVEVRHVINRTMERYSQQVV